MSVWDSTRASVVFPPVVKVIGPLALTSETTFRSSSSSKAIEPESVDSAVRFVAAVKRSMEPDALIVRSRPVTNPNEPSWLMIEPFSAVRKIRDPWAGFALS